MPSTIYVSNLQLLDDIQKLQPTIITLVPRVLSKIASAIQAATVDAPGFKGKLSRAALAAKYARMEGPSPTFHHPLWDRIWSRKIRQVLGGHVRILVSGSAPASRETLKFLRAALACDVIEGYGLTETFASALLCLPNDFTPGHCGPLVPTVEARLKDVPEMAYTSNDLPNPRGELLIRGHTVFKGYFKDEKKTVEAFDGDWFRTGDICEIDSAGRVYIIDRVKNFFKVSLHSLYTHE
jgi:long-chain acyl-CoA synthetase